MAYVRSMHRRPVSTLLLIVGSLLIAAAPLAGAADAVTDSAGPVPAPADAGMAALAYAQRYADVVYATGDGSETGVAYMWGGRMGVDEYVAAVEAGAAPGEEAGVDASAVIVQSYRSVWPGLAFRSSTDSGPTTQDATSGTLYHFNVVEVAVDDLRAGDLIFFQDASGDVSGVAMFDRREGPNVHFIVASARAGRVIRTFYNINNESWRTQFKGAGRLLAYGL